MAKALPALEVLDILTTACARCQLSGLPSSMQELGLYGEYVSLGGGHCSVAPALAVTMTGIVVSLDVSIGSDWSRPARPLGAELLLIARKLWVHTDWADRHPGQQPSAAAVLVDCAVRQPFKQLTFMQLYDQQDLEIECMSGADDDQTDQPLCKERFDSLEQLHAACRSLASQACASCDLIPGPDTFPGSSKPACVLAFGAVQ